VPGTSNGTPFAQRLLSFRKMQAYEPVSEIISVGVWDPLTPENLANAWATCEEGIVIQWVNALPCTYGNREDKRGSMRSLKIRPTIDLAPGDTWTPKTKNPRFTPLKASHPQGIFEYMWEGAWYPHRPRPDKVKPNSATQLDRVERSLQYATVYAAVKDKCGSKNHYFTIDQDRAFANDPQAVAMLLMVGTTNIMPNSRSETDLIRLKRMQAHLRERMSKDTLPPEVKDIMAAFRMKETPEVPNPATPTSIPVINFAPAVEDVEEWISTGRVLDVQLGSVKKGVAYEVMRRAQGYKDPFPL